MTQAKKLSLEYERHGQRFAIDRIVQPEVIYLSNAPKLTIRIGFESITIERPLLGEMLRQLEMAEATGAQYPEDWERMAKDGYGLARE